MDPLASLLAALVAGAAGALKDTAADAVKDAYRALKRMLAERHKGIDVEAVERDPQAPEIRRTVERQLEASAAASDAEVVAAAKALLERLALHDPGVGAAIGVDLEGVTAGRVRIADIVAAGAGVRVKNATAAGDFEITGVRAGTAGGTRGKA
jgi:hypothetical protein